MYYIKQYESGNIYVEKWWSARYSHVVSIVSIKNPKDAVPIGQEMLNHVGTQLYKSKKCEDAIGTATMLVL